MKVHIPVATAVEAAARAGLKVAGKQILAASNALAPRDDGTLIKSGRATVDDLTLQVSYTAVHAPLQHENLDWRHEDGGQPKFLEVAARDFDIGAIMAAEMRRQLGG